MDIILGFFCMYIYNYLGFFFNTSSLEGFPSLLVDRLGNSLENWSLSEVFFPASPILSSKETWMARDTLGRMGCAGLAEMRMLCGVKEVFYTMVLVPVVDSEPGFLPASPHGNKSGIGSKLLNCRHVGQLT